MGLPEQLGKDLDPNQANKDFNEICDDLSKSDSITCDRCGNKTPDNLHSPGHYICTSCDNSWQVHHVPF